MKKNAMRMLGLTIIFITGLALGTRIESCHTSPYKKEHAYRDEEGNLYIPIKVCEAKNICQNGGVLKIRGGNNDIATTLPLKGKYVGYCNDSQLSIYTFKDGNKIFEGGWNKIESDIGDDEIIYTTFLDPGRAR